MSDRMDAGSPVRGDEGQGSGGPVAPPAAAGDIAFVTCGESGRAGGPQSALRRDVRVGGKPARTVDVHAHCAVPAAAALYEFDKTAFPTTPPVMLTGTDVSTRLEAMDEKGIDIAALSINPFWYGAERDLAARIIELQNDALAEVCAAHPDRFVGLASIALQHPDLAADQLEHAVKRLGLRGALVGGSVEGEELASPRLHPFWRKAEELGVMIMIHPQPVPSLALDRLRGAGPLMAALALPLETTIALSHLIFEGTLDQFPDVKICACHGGGFLPSYSGRSDAALANFPFSCPVPLKKKPSEYLRQLYYDSIVITTEGLRHLIAEVGASQVMMGTDYPFPTPETPWMADPIQHIIDTPDLNDEDRLAILGGNAAKLLRLTF